MPVPGIAVVAGAASRLAGGKAVTEGAKQVAKQAAKKKMSKTKKAAVLGGVVLGGKAIIGSDGKPVEAGATGISTSDANAAAMQQAGNLVGMSGQGVGLAGLPIGSEIAQGGKAQLSKGAGALQFAALQPADRAQLILRLGQIPGLYAKGQAPTPGFIQRMISGKDVVPRPQDFAALEQVTAFAEWSGTNIQNTVTKLISQPGLAQQYFGKITTTPKAVTSSKALEAELNDKFLDIFETKASPEIAQAYAKEVNKLESSRDLSSQEKENILLKYIQKKASEQFALSETGMVSGVIDKGALGRRVRTLRAAYEDNGIPINEKQIYNKSVQSLRSEEAYRNEIDNVMMQAGTVMPAFKDFFAKGKTAREVLSPWINTRAQILGVPADQIKVSDMYDVGSGAAPVSIQEYKKQLYKSPEFKKTDAYKERSLGDMQTLLKAFNIG
jgi:hypothetical protein